MSTELTKLMDILRSNTMNAPSGLSAKEIAERIGVGYSTLMNGVNKHVEGHKFHLNNLLPFMRATGSVMPLRFLCLSMGFDLRPNAGAADAVHSLVVDDIDQLCISIKAHANSASVLDDAHRAHVRNACRKAMRALLELSDRMEEHHA